jgi:hypothetical protein
MFQLWKSCFSQNAISTNELRDEFCGNDTTTDQYAMFRYTSIEDLRAVYAYRSDRRLSNIVSLIKENRWIDFLNTYSATPDEAHFILMAAYRYGHDSHQNTLTAKETATAFYFLSIAIDDPGFQIGQPGRQHHHFGLTEEKWASIPKNEQVAIYIHFEKLSLWARAVICTTILAHPKPSQYLAITRIAPHYELSSASVLEKNIYQDSPKKMHINFGLSTRREYLNGIFNGENSYALVTPYSKSPNKIQYIHGVSLQKGSAWASRHDGAHLYGRHVQFEHHYTNGIFQNEFKKIVFALEDIYEARPPIKARIIDEGYAKSHLSKDADAEDLATRLIDEMLIRYIDAEAVIKSLKNPNIQDIEKECRAHLVKTCERITQTTEHDPHRNNALNESNTDIIKDAIEIAANLVIPTIQNIVFPPAKDKRLNQ